MWARCNRAGDDVKVGVGIKKKALPVGARRKAHVGEGRLERGLVAVFCEILWHEQVLGADIYTAIASRDFLLGDTYERQVGLWKWQPRLVKV